MYPPYDHQNNTNYTNNTIDIAPSLTHSNNMSTNSTNSGMDLDSRPLEAHQSRIQHYGNGSGNAGSNEQQRQYQQHFQMMQQGGGGAPSQQQQQHQQQGNPLPYDHNQQQYQHHQHHQQQQQNFPQMPNPAYHYQHNQQQQQQQQQHYPPQHPTAGYPATECHLMTPSSGRSVETEMPSLAFSDNSNNSTLSKVLMPQGGRPVGVPPSPSPSVSPQAADSPEGVDADYFLTSVLNMIAPVGAAPPVAHYDYLAEFTQRQRIAKGGNGEIRRAYWSSRQSIVILKSLIDTKHTPAKIAQLFDKEVEVMNQCGHHDNLVQFYGVAIRNCADERNGDRFMIMQYYEHGDLVKLLEAPVLAPEAPSLTDRLYLAMDIATGLEHLYNCGFHHGDLHPKNILIDLRRHRSAHEGRYQARLTDFGLRRIRDNKNAFSSQQFGGVWQFMAPERMAKNRPRYDVRCDIFALGVIYWFIMAGRYPFKDFSTFRPGAREPMVEGTPHWYHTVYTQAWNEDPNARQQTLGDIIQVFRHQLGIPPPAPPPSQYLDPNYPRPPYPAASYGYDHGSYPSPQYDARLFSDSSSTNGGSTARGSPMLTPAPMLTPTSLNRSGSPHPPSPLLSNAPAAPSTATPRASHPNHPRYRKPIIPNGLPVNPNRV